MTHIPQLDALRIPYRLAEHNGVAYSAEQAAESIGLPVASIVKTLLLLNGEHQLFMVLVPGDQRIEMSLLRKELKDQHIRFVPRDKVLEVSGYEVGLVGPYGDKYSSALAYAGQSIMQLKECAVSSGQLGVEIILSGPDLLASKQALLLDHSLSLRED